MRTSAITPEAIFAMARGYHFYVAAHWPGSLQELAAALGCDEFTACSVALCRAPERRERRSWITTVSRRYKISQPKLRRMLSQLEVQNV